MTIESILHEIDLEIARLQKVKSILTDQATATLPKQRPNKTATVTHSAPKKRILSPEARAKIAAAQKRRWAAHKKSAK